MTTSADRAAMLAAASVDEEADRIRREEHAIAAARRCGNWRWTPIGEELHFRNKLLPTLRLDVLRSEASDLMQALSKALGEKLPRTPRPTKTQRTKDSKARKAWDKAHAGERAVALKMLAEEFSQRGGW